MFDFSVITGLRCFGDCCKLNYCTVGGGLCDGYFFDKEKVKKNDIEECISIKGGNMMMIVLGLLILFCSFISFV